MFGIYSINTKQLINSYYKSKKIIEAYQMPFHSGYHLVFEDGSYKEFSVNEIIDILNGKSAICNSTKIKEKLGVK